MFLVFGLVLNCLAAVSCTFAMLTIWPIEDETARALDGSHAPDSTFLAVCHNISIASVVLNFLARFTKVSVDAVEPVRVVLLFFGGRPTPRLLVLIFFSPYFIVSFR